MRITYPDLCRDIRSGDYDRIDQAVEQMRLSGSKNLFYRLLRKTFIDGSGRLWVNPAFFISLGRQPAIDYAFWQMLSIAPTAVRRGLGITRNRERKIAFIEYGEKLNEKFRITRFPYHLHRLKVISLDASQADFSEFPQAIRKITGLKKLNLAGRRFRQIPQWIGELKDLEYLCISGCTLDAFPESIVSLKKIVLLSLIGSTFKVFPDPIAQLSSLRYLILTECSLKSFPAGSFIDSELQYLDLSRNQLQEIPNGISCLRKLRTLYLGQNPKLRSIHPDFAALAQLEVLTLDRCVILEHVPTRRNLHGRDMVYAYQRKLLRVAGRLIPEEETFKRARRNSSGSGLRKTYISSFRPPEMPEGDADRCNTIISLLTSQRRGDPAAGMRLLLANGDPWLAEYCLSVFDVDSSGQVTNTTVSYSSDREFQLTEILSVLSERRNFLPDGRYTWLGSIRDLELLVDNQKIVPDLGLFPGLRRLSLNIPLHWDEFLPVGWQRIHSLSIESLSTVNFRLSGSDAPLCRTADWSHISVRGEFMISALPELRKAYIKDSDLEICRITGCTALASVGLKKLSCVSLIIEDCPALKKIDIDKISVTRIIIRNCPGLTALNWNDVSCITIHMDPGESPRLREVRLGSMGGHPPAHLQVMLDAVLPLPGLRQLDISQNQLDNLPDLSSASGLQILSVQSNRLKNLHQSVYSLKNLEFLYVGLQGSFSPVGNLLKKLDPELSNLSRLKTFDITWPESRYHQQAWNFRQVLIANKSDRFTLPQLPESNHK